MSKKRSSNNPIGVASRLLDFRTRREANKSEAEELKHDQPEVIAEMKEVDPENNGIVFDPSDEHKGTAYVQQNEPSEVWDDDAIQKYLSHPSRKALRTRCSTRVLDIRKFEAEVAAGNITPAAIRKSKMKVKPEKPAPFIRFGRANDKSIEG